jgi:methyl-accepting chemotaxis protein
LSDQRLEALVGIVQLLAVSMERIEKDQLKEQERLDLAENVNVLNSLLRSIRTVKSKEEAVQAGLSQICSGFGFKYASFWEVQQDESVLAFIRDYGKLSDEFMSQSRKSRFRRGEDINGHTWKIEKVYFVESFSQLKESPRATEALKAGVQSAICLPVFINGTVTGTMDFLTTDRLNFSTEKMSLLSSLAQIVSNTIERFENVNSQVHMASEISETLAQATGSLEVLCQDILVNSEETANQTQTLSSASEEVNVSFNEVANATEEMSASISEISKNMHKAADITNKAEAIGLNTKNHVDRLANSAKEVYTIVELIKGIASQTNLLSLNATIEASTAGDAGKGFAVVANEVKELAKQSAEAADQIRNQVTDIQNNIANTISSINEITSIVSEMSTINNVVATAVEEQSYTTSEISRSLNGILVGVKEITKSIVHVASISGKTSENARSSHESTSDIARMSEKLKSAFAKLTF